MQVVKYRKREEVEERPVVCLVTFATQAIEIAWSDLERLEKRGDPKFHRKEIKRLKPII